MEWDIPKLNNLSADDMMVGDGDPAECAGGSQNAIEWYPWWCTHGAVAEDTCNGGVTVA